MLPKSYQGVEYLESTGTQYIDTGIVPTATMDFEIGVTSVRNNTMLFGSRWTGASTYDTYGMFKSNDPSINTTIYWGRLSSGDSTSFFPGQYPITIKLSNNVISSTTADATVAITRHNFVDTQLSIFLFCLNNLGSPALMSSAKISNFSLSDSNAKVINLVPCYRISDNKPGMYDTVRDLFLTNQGTGEFVTGPPVYQPMYRETHPYEMGRRRKALISATRVDYDVWSPSSNLTNMSLVKQALDSDGYLGKDVYLLPKYAESVPNNWLVYWPNAAEMALRYKGGYQPQPKTSNYDAIVTHDMSYYVIPADSVDFMRRCVAVITVEQDISFVTVLDEYIRSHVTIEVPIIATTLRPWNDIPVRGFVFAILKPDTQLYVRKQSNTSIGITNFSSSYESYVYDGQKIYLYEPEVPLP